MKRDVVKVDAIRVASATSLSIRRKDACIKAALLAVTDPDKVNRKEKQYCISCFYLNFKIAGAAMTTQPCGLCGVPVLYPSTNTDILCRKCAQQNDLCMHCAGDFNMRERRTFKEVK